MLRSSKQPQFTSPFTSVFSLFPALCSLGQQLLHFTGWEAEMPEIEVAVGHISAAGAGAHSLGMDLSLQWAERASSELHFRGIIKSRWGITVSS